MFSLTSQIQFICLVHLLLTSMHRNY